jgi:hypothetical protein
MRQQRQIIENATGILLDVGGGRIQLARSIKSPSRGKASRAASRRGKKSRSAGKNRGAAAPLKAKSSQKKLARSGSFVESSSRTSKTKINVRSGERGSRPSRSLGNSQDRDALRARTLETPLVRSGVRSTRRFGGQDSIATKDRVSQNGLRQTPLREQDLSKGLARGSVKLDRRFGGELMSEARERTFEEIARDWNKNNRIPRNDGSVRSFSQFVKLCVRQTKSNKKKKDKVGATGRKPVRPFRTVRIARKVELKLED